MTAFGKFLVVANFVVSVVVAGWSMAFFFTRIDWTEYPNTPAAPSGFDAYIQNKKKELGDAGPVTPLDRELAYNDPTVGRMLGRIAHLKGMLDQARAAEASWRDGRYQVAVREAFRPVDRADFRNKLALLSNAPAETQLQQIVLGPDGQPDLQTPDPQFPSHKVPKLQNATDLFKQPLHSLAVYQKAYQDNRAALSQGRIDLEKAVQQDSDLTAALTGGTGPNGIQIAKGLRKRIEDERFKGQDVLAEYEAVKPLLLKTVGDSEYLLARRRQLEKRIKELEETPVTKAE